MLSYLSNTSVSFLRFFTCIFFVTLIFAHDVPQNVRYLMRFNSKAPSFQLLDSKSDLERDSQYQSTDKRSNSKEKVAGDETWLPSAIQNVVQQALSVDKETENITSASIIHKVSNGSIVISPFPTGNDKKQNTSVSLNDRWTYTPYRRTTPKRRTSAGFWPISTNPLLWTTTVKIPTIERAMTAKSSTTKRAPASTGSLTSSNVTTTTPGIPRIDVNTTSQHFQESLDRFLVSLSNRINRTNVNTSSFYDTLNALLVAADAPTTTDPIRTTGWWQKDPNLQFSELSSESYEDDEKFLGHRPLQASDESEIPTTEKHLSAPPGHPSFLNLQSRPTTKSNLPESTTTKQPTTTKRANSQRSTPTAQTTTKPKSKAKPITTTTRSTSRPTTSTTTRPTTRTTVIPTTKPTTTVTTAKPPIPTVIPDFEYETEFSTPLELEATEPNLQTESPTELNYVVINIWNYVNGVLKLMDTQTVTPPKGFNGGNGALYDENHDEGLKNHANQPSHIPTSLQQAILNQLILPLKSNVSFVTPVPPPGGVGNPTPNGSFRPFSATPSTPFTSHLSPIYNSPPSQIYGPPLASSNYPTDPELISASAPFTSFDSLPVKTTSQLYGLPPKQTPSSSYGVPQKTPSSFYDVPQSTSGSSYDAPQKIPSSSYGVPLKAPTSFYESPQGTIGSSYFAPQKIPSTSYGVPQKTSSSYDSPQTNPISSYDPQKSPSSTYGVPQKTPSSFYDAPQSIPSSSYGVPQKTPSSFYDAPHSTLGSSSIAPQKNPGIAYIVPQKTSYSLPQKSPSSFHTYGGASIQSAQTTNKGTILSSGAIKPAQPSTTTDKTKTPLGVPAPATQQPSSLTLYGYNSPPLSAILPDFIVETLKTRPKNTPGTEDIPPLYSATFQRSGEDPKIGTQSIPSNVKQPFYRPSSSNFQSPSAPASSRDNDGKPQSSHKLENPIVPQVPNNFYSQISSRNNHPGSDIYYSGGRPHIRNGNPHQSAYFTITPPSHLPSSVVALMNATGHPLPSSYANQRNNYEASSSEQGYQLSTQQPARDEDLAESTTIETVTRNNGNRNSLMALGLSMLPTLVLALPAIGRKRRAADSQGRHSDQIDDPLKYLQDEVLEQMRRNGIPTSHCKPMTYMEGSPTSRRVIVCPGTSPKAVNMILLDQVH